VSANFVSGKKEFLEVLSNYTFTSSVGLPKKVKDPFHLSGLIPLFLAMFQFLGFCDLDHLPLNLKLFFFCYTSLEVVCFRIL